MWSTGGGNDNLLWYSYRENPMNTMKRQKDITLEDEPPKLEGVQYVTWKIRGQLLMAPERMQQLSQSRSDTWFWICLVVQVTSVVKSNIA